MWLKGAMALIQHCLLLLLLLEALRARAAWAAPWQEQEAGEDAAKVYRDAWQAVGLEPLGRPGAVAVGKAAADSQRGSRTEPLGDRTMGVPVGRTRPAPRQWDAARGWHRRGSAIEKYRAEGENESSELFEQLRHVLEEWKRGHVPSKPGEDHQSKINRAYEPGSDVISERTARADDPPNTASPLCPQDARRHCMIGTAATMLSVPVGIVLVCVIIRWWMKKEEPVAGASRVQQKTHGSRFRPDSKSSRASTPQSCTQRQQRTLPPEQRARSSSPWPPRPPPPFAAAFQQRSQTSTLQTPAKGERPPRPPNPSPAALQMSHTSTPQHPTKWDLPSPPPSPFLESLHQMNQESFSQMQQSPRPPRPPPLLRPPSPPSPPPLPSTHHF
ncbi:protein enabled homolog isoform X1 [Falco peregrinus]|uniref:protein enabled homolog isoform X1 n=1 Tax=Falco peregrinus TaxID=8954 RepID=UPI002479ABA7|nr:protein enabled homolog isoform X1 [Falco peregrinus]